MDSYDFFDPEMQFLSVEIYKSLVLLFNTCICYLAQGLGTFFKFYLQYPQIINSIFLVYLINKFVNHLNEICERISGLESKYEEMTTKMDILGDMYHEIEDSLYKIKNPRRKPTNSHSSSEEDTDTEELVYGSRKIQNIPNELTMVVCSDSDESELESNSSGPNGRTKAKYKSKKDFVDSEDLEDSEESDDSDESYESASPPSSFKPGKEKPKYKHKKNLEDSESNSEIESDSENSEKPNNSISVYLGKNGNRFHLDPECKRLNKTNNKQISVDKEHFKHLFCKSCQ